MTESATTQQQKQFKILLIGDNCKDIYQYGTVDRISPEAPVPVFVPVRIEEHEGMAGNVAKNLEALGCHVNFLYMETSIKTRLIDMRSKQQIVRIDNDIKSDPLTFETAIPNVYDAIVISDYDKGTVTYSLIEELRKEFSGPIFVDTKKQDLKRFNGCFVKINELEYNRRTSLNDQLIVTLGEYGAIYKQGQAEVHQDAPKVEVSDVCGAGDTFLSALTYKYLETTNMNDAVAFAMRAASITVQHVGVYAPRLEEIK
jgi:D-beta-D-heptose 7-phosphate kinase/D-beta-D-heptose 1-phosphate adenosyltransferase